MPRHQKSTYMRRPTVISSLILLAVLVIFLPGCVAFLAGQLGYQEANEKYTRLYDTYKIEKETINIERIKLGLPPEPVEEFKVWLKTQPLNNREIRLFKHFGVLSPQEANEMKQARKRRLPLGDD